MRSLRTQLVFSHILPLLAAVPILYIALSYLLETQLLLPTLAQNLADDARLLTDIAHRAYLASGGDITTARIPFSEMEMNPEVRLVLLGSDSDIEYSNDPDFLDRIGQSVKLEGIDQVKGGETVMLTNYSFIPGQSYAVQVIAPVFGLQREVVGVIWLTYYDAALTQLFQQMRAITILVTLSALLVGGVLGLIIAVNISRPVRRAAEAIDGIARSAQEAPGAGPDQPLAEQGPEEVRELARSVNVLVARLHSLEQARRQLLANLVHELGRPLGALRAAIQALAKGAGDDPQLLAELTTGMDEEAARLQNIVEDLAHLYSQILGPLELQMQPTALNEWLPGVLAPWHEAAAEKNIEWTANVEENLPSLEVDQLRLGQVIGNLASNAVKYTPPGGVVQVQAGLRDGQVAVSFVDSGPGISPDEQEKVFQPFYRGSQGRRIKMGMGLGLSIARDLAAAHGGRITLENGNDGGSIFTLWLPL